MARQGGSCAGLIYLGLIGLHLIGIAGFGLQGLSGYSESYEIVGALIGVNAACDCLAQRASDCSVLIRLPSLPCRLSEVVSQCLAPLGKRQGFYALYLRCLSD